MKPQNLYIGLMSGTSLDGVDCVVASFEDSHRVNIISSYLAPIAEDLKKTALNISLGDGKTAFTQVAELDLLFGQLFASSINDLLTKAKLSPQQITAIGSHGQTLWHHPRDPYPFTVQIGDPNIIAKSTGITTVADFRRADMALGGQGAPFVPPFHQWLVGQDAPRIVLNIGGIANITVLKQHACIGYDTGPGNGLMDAWIKVCQDLPFDKDGAFARQGNVSDALLATLLNDPFFAQQGPKSTGKDYFNLSWLKKHLQGMTLPPADVQATLLELTAVTIANTIKQHHQGAEIVVCGGGSHNKALMQALTQQLGKSYPLTTTEMYGLHPDWVEAACFAWLAKMRLDNQAVDLTAITGSLRPTILGGVYAP